MQQEIFIKKVSVPYTFKDEPETIKRIATEVYEGLSPKMQKIVARLFAESAHEANCKKIAKELSLSQNAIQRGRVVYLRTVRKQCILAGLLESR